jgi:hypothetical protein
LVYVSLSVGHVLYGIYELLYPSGFPWVGVFRACAVVLGAMSLVYWMAKKKIIWRVLNEVGSYESKPAGI